MTKIPELPKPSYNGKCPKCNHPIADSSYNHDPDERFDANDNDDWPGVINQIHALDKCPNCGVKIAVFFRVEIEVIFNPKIEVIFCNSNLKYIQWAKIKETNKARQRATNRMILFVDNAIEVGRWVA